MFTRLKQILNDHKAMNVIRAGHGDAHLIAFAGVNGMGWDCHLFQREKSVSAPDPAEAILKAEQAHLAEKARTLTVEPIFAPVDFAACLSSGMRQEQLDALAEQIEQQADDGSVNYQNNQRAVAQYKANRS